MLRSLKEMERYKVSATDGEVGHVADFLFDDRHWTTRYLIADTGGFWAGPHQVLISPISFRKVDWTTQLFHLGLSQAKIQGSPGIDLAKPVSRQYEQDYSQYYGWPYYWDYGEAWAWGAGAYPYALADCAPPTERQKFEQAHNDPHLRSAKEITGYHVRGKDGEVGHIADFIVDDETWAIRYLVVDTSNWWIGRKVLVAPHWAQEISWTKRMVYVNLTIDVIKTSPEWDPSATINREYEERLYDYYGRPVYWQRGSGNAEVVSETPATAKHLSV
jgi:sporulation protein YlmC with PRC-barrel domain